MQPIDYSKRISTVTPSAIREILKVTQDPTVISFAAGNPATESFPAKEFNEIISKILTERPGYALQYGISEGYPVLRTLLKKRLWDKYGIGQSFDDTIIVTGGQQGIEMTAKTLLDDGDTLVCEEPSFLGALNAFRSYNAVLKGIPVEKDGLDLEKLEALLKEDKRVKLVYVIPTFQNPSGRVMSLAKRKALLELAERYNFMILEDNPYYDLRYDGEVVPTIFLHASSGGRVADEVVNHLCERMAYYCQNEEFDGIYAALHGATCSENEDDACGFFLEILRKLAGDKPIAASFWSFWGKTAQPEKTGRNCLHSQTFPSIMTSRKQA